MSGTVPSKPAMTGRSGVSRRESGIARRPEVELLPVVRERIGVRVGRRAADRERNIDVCGYRIQLSFAPENTILERREPR